MFLVPSEKGSILKGKNLLPTSRIRRQNGMDVQESKPEVINVVFFDKKKRKTRQMKNEQTTVCQTG